MATTTLAPLAQSTYAARRERRKTIAYGAFFLLVAVAILVFFIQGTEAGLVSTFKLNPVTKGKIIPLPDLVVPSQLTLIVLMVLSAILGLYQVARGFKSVYLVLGIVTLAFVFAFLVWAVRGKSINLLGILTLAVAAATPIAFAALSGLMCERSGVINIAIEGQMLMGAMVAVIGSSLAGGSQWVGLLAAVIAGGLLGAVLAVLAIRFVVDQIIAGVAINIFATGITSFISQRFLQPSPTLNSGGIFPKIPLPGLSQIPILGPLVLQSDADYLYSLPSRDRDQLHAVVYPLGVAHAGCWRAPQSGRHPGHQRLSRALRECDRRRHDRRSWRLLLHHRLGGPV